METSTNIAGLIAKFIAAQISQQEQQELDRWIDGSETNRRFFLRVTDKDYAETRLEKYRSFNSMRAWANMHTVAAPLS